MSVHALEPAATSSPWNTTPPPQDGTHIVAVGRVICSDDISTWVEPFVAELIWETDRSGYEGWHHTRDQMSVARTLDDVVKIDWWVPVPKEAA